MRLFTKIVVSALVFLAVHFFSYWMVFAQIFSDGQQLAPAVAAFLAAVVVAVWVWHAMATADQGILAAATYWAAIAGAFGFCGGFFGPMFFTPDANQGPMLGLFITGPLGFIGGGIFGLIYALWHRPKNNALS